MAQLLESIISMNSGVKDLGEINIFEESYREYIESEKKTDLLKYIGKN